MRAYSVAITKVSMSSGTSMGFLDKTGAGKGYEWIWCSSMPDVAAVAQDGTVTAKQPGEAAILAYTLWGDSAEFEVEVK